MKDRLFMEMNSVCVANITLMLPNVPPVLILILMLSAGPRQEGERGSVPEQVTKGGSKGWSCD